MLSSELRTYPPFRQQAEDREFVLLGQQYAPSPFLWEVTHEFRKLTGKDLFVYMEGRENIIKDQIQLCVDGEAFLDITNDALVAFERRWKDGNLETSIQVAETAYSKYRELCRYGKVVQ